METGLSRFDRKLRVLAVASGGGHWVQMMRMRPALEENDVAFVTVSENYRGDVGTSRFYVVNDATRWNKAGLALMLVRLLVVLLRERPDVVISTGAAPGYFALRLGKLLGAKTIWVDSIANADTMSLSGMRIGPYADLWLTQWPHLAQPQGPRFEGAVL